MKKKLKLILIVSGIIFTIIISNLGQLILSNEKFQKNNKPLLSKIVTI